MLYIPKLFDSFQTTYEELKRGYRSWWGADFYRLPDYLWGIETNLYPFTGVSISSFQTTYEELKQRSVTIGLHILELPDYLWGIETHKVFDNNSKIKLPDYLWGIETVAKRGNSEEMELLPDYLWGIETPILRSRLVVQNFRFQTTYEELKPPILPSLELIPELPDYLWGIETSLVLRLSCSFALKLPDYLWGIETLVCQRLFEHHPSASRLPMRNWNPEEIQAPISNQSFQTTYEELKLLAVEFLWPVRPLPDYLWGIETFSFYVYLLQPGSASRLPMRNWNLCYCPLW